MGVVVKRAGMGCADAAPHGHPLSPQPTLAPCHAPIRPYLPCLSLPSRSLPPSPSQLTACPPALAKPQPTACPPALANPLPAPQP